MQAATVHGDLHRAGCNHLPDTAARDSALVACNRQFDTSVMLSKTRSKRIRDRNWYHFKCYMPLDDETPAEQRP
jgi:hypothetical protein